MRKLIFNRINIFVFIICLGFCSGHAYPIDGFVKTGIKRLLYLQRVQSGQIKGTLPVAGGMLPMDNIHLHLVDHNIHDFPDIDPDLQKDLNKLFPNLHESYSLALLDYSSSDNLRYAERHSQKGFQPGSVGKLAVLTGLFCELENIYPYDFDKRIDLLKNKKVRAGEWAIPNIHTIPIFDPESDRLTKRLIIQSDVFTLYEWLDHMLSVSSNGAASVVWREIMLMREFGSDYPGIQESEAESYFKKTSKRTLSDISVDVVNSPLREIGIMEDELRLGTFFTRGASNRIPPQGGSIGTPQGLAKWMWYLEHGQIIDKESSLEIKKLLYQTDKRIRYAANNKLKDAAVFFKSGSLYKCKEESGYNCGKYMGNVYNYMNSVSLVEHKTGKKYMVVLMTNVLKKNSNNDHNALAGWIDEMITK